LAAGREDDEHVDILRETPDQSERLGQAGTPLNNTSTFAAAAAATTPRSTSVIQKSFSM
jgi:hypothetical protein